MIYIAKYKLWIFNSVKIRCWLLNFMLGRYFQKLSASSKPTTEFTQPRLSRVKGWASPARGYKFGCVCSYMACELFVFVFAIASLKCTESSSKLLHTLLRLFSPKFWRKGYWIAMVDSDCSDCSFMQHWLSKLDSCNHWFKQGFRSERSDCNNWAEGQPLQSEQSESTFPIWAAGELIFEIRVAHDQPGIGTASEMAECFCCPSWCGESQNWLWKSNTALIEFRSRCWGFWASLFGFGGPQSAQIAKTWLPVLLRTQPAPKDAKKGSKAKWFSAKTVVQLLHFCARSGRSATPKASHSTLQAWSWVCYPLANNRYPSESRPQLSHEPFFCSWFGERIAFFQKGSNDVPKTGSIWAKVASWKPCFIIGLLFALRPITSSHSFFPHPSPVHPILPTFLRGSFPLLTLLLPPLYLPSPPRPCP